MSRQDLGLANLENSDSGRKPWVDRFSPILVVTGICWVVFAVNNLILDGHLSRYGILPRHLSGLLGILWAPFLHSSFGHLAANTVPLLVLGAFVAGRGKPEFLRVTVEGVLITGAITWLFGRTALHVGASGLIFCFFGYLASLAYFRRTFGALVISIICLFAYGGMLRGILPTSQPVSWEGHAAGLIAGVLLAWAGAKRNPPSTA